jgi:hypothetical protein
MRYYVGVVIYILVFGTFVGMCMKNAYIRGCTDVLHKEHICRMMAERHA